MNTDNDRKKEIECIYAEITSSKKSRPTYSDFVEYSVSRDAIRSRFGGIEKLHAHMDEHYGNLLAESFMTLEKAFSEEKSVEKSDKKLYIITTAVADSKPHDGFLKALDTYSKENDAQIVIMPCESVTNSFEKKTAVFDSIFHDPKYLFVSNDIHLNSNICLCSIQVSAKQIRPITGLSRIGNREGSFVFASTKQFLEFIPSGNKRGTNYSIMTTGACTLPSYYSETFVSKRLSYIAEHDHLIGAVIVQIENDRIFHFRQVQASPDGSFIDLGYEYKVDGSVSKVESSIVFGDLHSANIDQNALDKFLRLFSNLDVKRVFLHDSFDGYSISHHVTTIAERSMRYRDNASNLFDELRTTYNVIKDIDYLLLPDEVVIVKSNHDEFLTRYLAQGRYVDDPENHYLSLGIARALFENQDVLKRGFEEVGLEVPDSWNFLDRNSSYKIADVECGSHGDLGLNGAKPSLVTLEKVYGNCIIGHAHTAAIHRGVFRVGTLSKLDMGYNKGPTSWTQTCCIIYENGQRQLINMIENKCVADETV